MPTVSSWFEEFAMTLKARSGRSDWPDMATEGGLKFWDDFETSLRRMGATWEQADEASSAACDMPEMWPDKFRPFVVGYIQKLQARQLAEGKGIEAGSLDEAKALSRDCPDCEGTGGAIRYVHEEILGKVRTFGGNVAPVGTGVTYPCSCPLGKWVARGLRQEGQTSPVLTVDQYPSLRMRAVIWSDRLDNPYRHHPDRWDADAGMPHDAGEVIDSAAELRILCRSLSRSEESQGQFVPRPPRTPQEWEARAVPARADIADAIPDPIIERERPQPAVSRPEEIHILEDDIANWL